MSCRMRLSNGRATLRGAVEFVGSTESRPTKISPCKMGHLVFIFYSAASF